MKNPVFDSLDLLQKILRNILAGFSQKYIASITEYDFILEELSVAVLEEVCIIYIEAIWYLDKGKANSSLIINYSVSSEEK